MDLQLYARVLWRFRLIVAVGLFLAFALSFLSYFKVSLADGKPSVSHREAEVWRSDGTLFVTQPGFPWGRIVVFQDLPSADEEKGAKSNDPPFGSPDRFTELAILYSHLAQSDAVKRLIAADGPVNGSILAEPVASSDGDSLPLVGITAMADSPAGAVKLAERQVDAFTKYIAQEQERNGIPKNDRVIIEQVDQPRAAALEVPRKKTEPIAIFLAVCIATLGAAFVLENLRPNIRQLQGGEVDAALPVELRRSA